jgi:hypothetical protein
VVKGRDDSRLKQFVIHVSAVGDQWLRIGPNEQQTDTGNRNRYNSHGGGAVFGARFEPCGAVLEAVKPVWTKTRP